MTAFRLPPPTPGGFVPLWPVASTTVPRFSDEGLLLGHRTRLVDFAGARAAPADEAARAACLYAIAVDKQLSNKSRTGLETALGHWARGDKALAQLRLVFADLPRLQSPAEAAFLAEAADLLDHGVTPANVMKRFGLEPYEDLAKFNPAQPRVPAGSGRDSGRWTDGEGAAGGTPASTLIEGASAAPPLLSPAVLKPDDAAPDASIVAVRAGGVVKPAPPDPQAATAWQSFKESFAAWLQEEVPIYDQDTGLQYGTQSRERAILTNPLIVGALATAGLLGGEVVAGATVGAEGFSVGALLPDGTIAGARALGADTNLLSFARKLGLNAKSSTTQRLLENLNLSVDQYLSRYMRGSVRREFPTEHLDKTIGEALALGISKVHKILTDKRFMK